MNVEEFKKALESHSPCEEGKALFDGCRNRKDLYCLAASPEAADYLLKSIKEGWGPSAKDIETVFRPYVNGGLTASYSTKERKVHSQIWCRSGDVSVDNSVRRLILIGCCGTVQINDWQVVKVYVDSTSNVEFICGKNCLVFINNFGGRITGQLSGCKIKDF